MNIMVSKLLEGISGNACTTSAIESNHLPMGFEGFWVEVHKPGSEFGSGLDSSRLCLFQFLTGSHTRIGYALHTMILIKGIQMY